jgi:hypothetical protein
MSEINLKVIEGLELEGRLNTSDEQIVANVESAIRRQHPQIKPQSLQNDRVCLVGSGPSLAKTEGELVRLLQEGAKLVTVNGAYHWCLERNLKPSAQVIIDARPENVRFVQPDVPGCVYMLASQCHPKIWDAVEGRQHVWIFHTLNDGNKTRELLDQYYLGRWKGVSGGTTVATRALVALRILGYLRFDLFGIDSCVMDGVHHAMPQPENEHDKFYDLKVGPSSHPEIHRTFTVTPWHVKQFEDILQFVRVNGEFVLVNVHGDGLIAYALGVGADLAIDEV